MENLPEAIKQAIHAEANAKVSELLRAKVANYAESVSDTDYLLLTCLPFKISDIPLVNLQTPMATTPSSVSVNPAEIAATIPETTEAVPETTEAIPESAAVMAADSHEYSLNIYLNALGIIYYEISRDFVDITEARNNHNMIIGHRNVVNTEGNLDENGNILPHFKLPQEFVRLLVNEDGDVDIFNGRGPEKIRERAGINAQIAEDRERAFNAAKLEFAEKSRDFEVYREQQMAELAQLRNNLNAEIAAREVEYNNKVQDLEANIAARLQEMERVHSQAMAHQDELLASFNVERDAALTDITTRQIKNTAEYNRIVFMNETINKKREELQVIIANCAKYKNIDRLKEFIYRAKEILVQLEFEGIPKLDNDISRKLDELLSEFYTEPVESSECDFLTESSNSSLA